MSAFAPTMIAVPIRELDVSVYTVPTDLPEADGTLRWRETTVVIVRATAGASSGIGYTYADAATAALIRSLLAGVVLGRDAMSPQSAWQEMVVAVRNLGRPGIASMAIAAVDIALWDLKAKLVELPLCTLLGQVNRDIPVYASGGFTSYSRKDLSEQFGAWVAEGIPRVKMKVGRHPDQDLVRVRAAREIIGGGVELMIDANGAYSPKQALALAERFAAEGVTWFEEPVSSDDLVGLRLLRDRCPAQVSIAAGEYGYDLAYFVRLLSAGAVDVLQADVTRCSGITELMRVGALCAAHNTPLSLHGAPAVHLHPALALTSVIHSEYFHDHTRVERLLFDGVSRPDFGVLLPDLERPGIGLEFKAADAARYAV